ncbi:unnamed protein product, partial [Hapterophycus canaliculatus]
ASGDIFGNIGESAGDVFGGFGGFFSDIGDALGSGIDEVGDWVGDTVGNGLDAVGDLAQEGWEAAADLAEDVGELAGDGLEVAGEAAEDIGDAVEGGLDAAGGFAEDAAEGIEDALDGVDGDGGADDVDMYAGAGPMDFDDEGPTGGGNFAKVLAGPRHLVEAFTVQHDQDSSYLDVENPGLDADRCLIGVGEWTGERLTTRENRSWEETMFARAEEVDRPDAFPYKLKLHEFRAGRACPSPDCRVTLVTQCTADRLDAVTQQALRWGGDISLAVYVPSAPSLAASMTSRKIRRLCDVIDEAVRLKRRKSLFLDIAILEGAEADPARHDRSGALYPINTMRNLALLQARDDEFHPAPAVFLVDSDCLPSENLLDNLHCQDVLGRINVEDGGRRSGLGEASESGPAAIVVPCLEFAPGSENSRTEERAIPLGTQEVAKMLVDGEAQGFHIDYFFKGHGPTDFLRWAAAAREETPEALAYTVPFEPCFEPYVVVNKTVVPMYDERFRGYGMNKVSHLLCLAAGTPGTDTTSAVEPAEFVVLRKGFVFALPHERSPAWEETYGTCRDPLRRYQARITVKALWSKVQGEIIEGLPPIISSSTAKVAASLHLRPGCGLGRPPLPQPPPHRVC